MCGCTAPRDRVAVRSCRRDSSVTAVWRLGITLLLCSLVLHGGDSALALDRSGVRPQVLSLPSGPGSLEGLGQAFEPQLNTGTASYGVPIKVPPGVAGHAPALELRYDGGQGNGHFGLGWSLP